jgi:uncharacterized protein (DUF433 family)
MSSCNRAICNPNVLSGKPAIKGTRISVELIMGWLANEWSHEMIRASYPQLTRDDILAALALPGE